MNPANCCNNPLLLAIFLMFDYHQRNWFQTNGYRILDALSASGLRALRFAKEVPHVTHIVANDFSEQAVEIIKQNVVSNRVESLVSVSYADAT